LASKNVVITLREFKIQIPCKQYKPKHKHAKTHHNEHHKRDGKLAQRDYKTTHYLSTLLSALFGELR